MANKLFNANKPVAHNGRNGFDLSSSHCFCMRPGIVRPVFFQATCPNSSFKINVSDLVRADDLQTAAFLRGKQELDLFFIPYRLLFSNFDNIVFGRGEQDDPLKVLMISNEVPTVALTTLYEHAVIPFVIELVNRTYMNARKSNGDSIMFPRTLYRNLIQVYMRVMTGNLEFNVTDSQIDFMLYVMYFDAVSYAGLPNLNFYDLHPVGASLIQLLSSLGYGDVYQVVMNYFTQCFTGIDWTDDFDIEASFSIFIETLKTNVFTQTNPIFVNILPLIAYQKAWNDYYRDSINDDSQNYVNALTCNYSLTSWNAYVKPLYQCLGPVTVSSVQSILRNTIAYTYLRPRLRMFKKDLSCGIYSSTQFGDVAASSDIYNDVSPQYFVDNVPAGNGSEYQAYAIKYAFAMQKYRETLMRAGNRTKDLLMAEFGVKSRYIDDHYAHYLGSFSGTLDLNKISATADSGDYSVGQLSGNIFSSLSGQTVDFTCNDYGIIIGMMSFIPEVFHSAFGLNAQNIKAQQFDFYHEAFENMGLQPVSSQLFDVCTEEGHNSATTLGFGPRYNEYKQNLDLAHDTFVGSAPTQPLIVEGHSPASAFNFGSDSNFITLKPISQSLSTLKERSYMFPDCMDTIFRSLDDGTAENAHFKVGMDVQISAVLPMSVIGMM